MTNESPVESGGKWWIRYVLVPLAGTGGLVGFATWLVSYIAPSPKQPVSSSFSSVERALKPAQPKSADALTSMGSCRDVVDEGFESGIESTDWRLKEEGGQISFGAGYNGRGLTIARSTPGGEQFTHLERVLPPEWAGKLLRVEAMVKYDNVVGGGDIYHHAGHIDFEAFGSDGVPIYPDWGRFVGTRSEWQQYRADWKIPPNITSIVFRIGLQGVIGKISFDNVKLAVCD